SHRNNCAHCAPPAPIAPPRRISGDFTTFGVAPRASMGGGVGEDGVMTTDTHRSVDLDRTERGRYRASNVRGGQLVTGDGSTDDFTPVELLLTAIAGCSAIDVDFLTTKRAEPARFRVRASGEKLADHRMEGLEVTFDVEFGDDETGRTAQDRVPGA